MSILQAQSAAGICMRYGKCNDCLIAGRDSECESHRRGKVAVAGSADTIIKEVTVLPAQTVGIGQRSTSLDIRVNA